MSGNAPIDLKELRWRLDYLSERTAEYEKRRSQNSGKLPKSDWWRLAYCKYPLPIHLTIGDMRDYATLVTLPEEIIATA